MMSLEISPEIKIHKKWLKSTKHRRSEVHIIEVFNNHQHIYVQSKRCNIQMTKKEKKIPKMHHLVFFPFIKIATSGIKSTE